MEIQEISAVMADAVITHVDKEEYAENAPWHPHLKFKGVYLEHLIKGEDSAEQLSCHMVRIDPDAILELASNIRRLLLLMKTSTSALEKESVLLSLLSPLILRHADKPPLLCKAGSHVKTTNRVCEFIREHYSESLSLEQLSRVAGLSPFYFQRLF